VLSLPEQSRLYHTSIFPNTTPLRYIAQRLFKRLQCNNRKIQTGQADNLIGPKKIRSKLSGEEKKKNRLISK